MFPYAYDWRPSFARVGSADQPVHEFPSDPEIQEQKRKLKSALKPAEAISDPEPHLNTICSEPTLCHRVSPTLRPCAELARRLLRSAVNVSLLDVGVFSYENSRRHIRGATGG